MAALQREKRPYAPTLQAACRLCPHTTISSQGRAKTTSAPPRVEPYSSGAKPFIQPPQLLGTATYCPATLYVTGLLWISLPVWELPESFAGACGQRI